MGTAAAPPEVAQPTPEEPLGQPLHQVELLADVIDHETQALGVQRKVDPADLIGRSYPALPPTAASISLVGFGISSGGTAPAGDYFVVDDVFVS